MSDPNFRDLPPGVIPFRRPGEAPARGRPSGPVAARRRLVYDVARGAQGFVVTYGGTVLTRHETLEAAIANAWLIASNFWSEGVPSSVRIREDDGSISPICAFG